MSKQEALPNELLPHLFRQEYAKLTAVLCRQFGLQHIEIAEDIASDTFLKASEHWAINGIPDNPTGWLYTVAKNKTRDHLKHIFVFENQVVPSLSTEKRESITDLGFTDELIADSQLAMIFAVCNPLNPPENQICLTLQILCGFSLEEIANAFLTKRETIKKRLYRARVNLRTSDFQLKTLSKKEIELRLNTVLNSIYLLFNEGYFSKTNSQLVRKELCSEALRLTLVLIESNLTNTPQTNALMALMCYQSSRLEARTNTNGDVILFEDQDKNLWDSALIEKGNYYLVEACTGNERSKYHLEAGIAYWHTTPTDENKWQHILHLYNQLICIEYSPTTALNRVFAFSKVYGHEKALQEVEKLNLTESNYYHELMGYLYSKADPVKAIDHYKQAVELTKSKMEQQTLKKEIERLGKAMVSHRTN